MALDVKAGTFTLNTVTGNQSITGVGFQPKVVFFLPTALTTAGITAHRNVGFGVGVSSTERGCVTANSEDGVTWMDATCMNSDTRCFSMLNPGNTTRLYEADFVSQDSDGFTINIINAPSSGYIVGYIALGGTDLTKVKYGTFQGANSAGNQSVTGVGFKPDCVLFFNDWYIGPNAPQNHGPLNIGFAEANNQAHTVTTDKNSGGTSDSLRMQDTSNCIHGYWGVTQYALASLASLDADGFTVNWSDPHNDMRHNYVALKGIKANAGSLNTQTVVGNFSKTGVGFKPNIGLFMSFGNGASTTAVNGAYVSMGVAESNTSKFVCGGFSEDNVSPSNSSSFLATNRIYKNYAFTGALNGDIDFVSWDSDGFTLNQTDADPTANQIIYLVLGSSSAVKTVTAIITTISNTPLAKLAQVLGRVTNILTVTNTNTSKLNQLLKRVTASNALTNSSNVSLALLKQIIITISSLTNLGQIKFNQTLQRIVNIKTISFVSGTSRLKQLLSRLGLVKTTSNLRTISLRLLKQVISLINVVSGLSKPNLNIIGSFKRLLLVFSSKKPYITFYGKKPKNE